MSEALGDLYKEFNALKTRLGDLTEKFSAIETFIDEMKASQASAKASTNANANTDTAPIPAAVPRGGRRVPKARVMTSS